MSIASGRALHGSFINYGKEVECRCGWKGTRKDCVEKEFNTPHEAWTALAGREGVHWHCPKCEAFVDSYYWKMS